mgnify:CR=1 FL=1
MEALFDLKDFVETAPVLVVVPMHPCGIHTLRREDDAHVRDCWGNVCPCCGDDVLNGFLMGLNHGGAEQRMCVSLDLRLNHLSIDIRGRRLPSDRDLSACDTGWRIAPDGARIAPIGWFEVAA